jgi:hypothetical protein
MGIVDGAKMERRYFSMLMIRLVDKCGSASRSELGLWLLFVYVRR